MLHTKLSSEAPSRAGLSLSHPLSGLGARGREDRGSKGRDRDGTEGPGAAATSAEPIWERGECQRERANLRSSSTVWGLSQAVGRRGVRKDLGGCAGGKGSSRTRSPRVR